MNISLFRHQLENMINKHCAEAGSDTPDFVLAEYLMDCLQAFDKAVRARDHHSRPTGPRILVGPVEAYNPNALGYGLPGTDSAPRTDGDNMNLKTGSEL